MIPRPGGKPVPFFQTACAAAAGNRRKRKRLSRKFPNGASGEPLRLAWQCAPAPSRLGEPQSLRPGATAAAGKAQGG